METHSRGPTARFRPEIGMAQNIWIAFIKPKKPRREGSRFGNSGAPAAYLRVFLTLLATKTKQTGRQLRRESRRRIGTFLCEK